MPTSSLSRRRFLRSMPVRDPCCSTYSPSMEWKVATVLLGGTVVAQQVSVVYYRVAGSCMFRGACRRGADVGCVRLSQWLIFRERRKRQLLEMARADAEEVAERRKMVKVAKLAAGAAVAAVVVGFVAIRSLHRKVARPVAQP